MKLESWTSLVVFMDSKTYANEYPKFGQNSQTSNFAATQSHTSLQYKNL